MSSSPSNSSLGKRKQPDNQTLSTDRPPKRRGIIPKASPKFKQNVHHLKRNDIPEDAGGFKVCDYSLSHFHFNLTYML
jgi:hypothetical protein